VTATRIDERAGIREEVAFFGADRAMLYGCLHAPLRRVSGGVVICCSLHAELQEGYRTEVLLARALAGRGIAVQRFHYRGSGHSDGASRDVTFDSLREDAASAVERLRVATGVAAPALLGSRLGGLVAAAAARECADAPLVLWEPTLDPERYFREVMRARLIHELRAGRASRRSGEALAGELRTGSLVDVLGYPIHRALYESTATRTLPGELGDRPRPVLLADRGRGGELSAGAAELTAALRSTGSRVDVHVHREQPAWWFARATGRTLDALSRVTVDWLVRELAGGRA
jgi:alpha-beta hydrolase superfamily lysophospholipase